MTTPATQFLDNAVPAALDRALVYGDGVFETIACVAGNALLFDYHMARLQTGLQRLGIAADVPLIGNRIKETAASAGDAVIRLVVGRAGGARGYDPKTACHSVVQLSVFPSPQYSISHVNNGIALRMCQHRLVRNPALAGLKHLNRLDQVLAAAEQSEAPAQEGLMLDDQGCVIEGIFTNVFLLREGVLYTPDLSRCGVAGVMRAFILDQAREQDVPVSVTDLHLDDFLQAEACFVCNSVLGIWPVKAIAGTEVTFQHNEINRLVQLLHEMGYGRFYA